MNRNIIACAQTPFRKIKQLRGQRIASDCRKREEVGEMGNKLPGFRIGLILGATTVTLLCRPYPVHSQSATQTGASQERPAIETPDRPTGQTSTGQTPAGQTDDITRRDLARFDQFLDSHRDVADQLRKTPSLIDDPQFLQRHPELNTYLQDHPSVKQEISERPDTFMRLEDQYARDANLRDRDAGGQDRDADRRDVANGQDRDADHRNDGDRRDVASFDRFLDGHREIAEQVRKDPSLLDNRNFVQNHPELQTYFQDNPGVRDQIRQDPNAFMRQEDAFNRDANVRDRDAGGARDNDRRDVVNFDRFLDGHREIAEQVRKDPALVDNRDFVRDHPALQAYLQDNPGVRDQLRQDPNGFMRQEDALNRDSNMRDRDPMHDRMADFGGFLHDHSDIQKDVSRDPSCVKDQKYVHDHAELDAYLNAHPDVRAELMANPQGFVHGAQQYGNSSTGAGAGVSGRGTGTTGTGTGMTGSMTGTSTTGTSTNPATTHEPPKPNQ
jgi:hypothetical protein